MRLRWRLTMRAAGSEVCGMGEVNCLLNATAISLSNMTQKIENNHYFLNYAILKFPIQIPHKKLKCTYLYKIISMSEFRM